MLTNLSAYGDSIRALCVVQALAWVGQGRKGQGQTHPDPMQSVSFAHAG